MAKAKKFVKFNVGGQAFQVSQSLLDSFPNTMISKSALERWRTKDLETSSSSPPSPSPSPSSSTTTTEVEEEEIFIERDGEKFRLILDYMRDGKMYLPTSITKEAMMVELLYYCFDDIDPDIIDNSSIYNTENFHIIYCTLKESANQALTEVQNEYKRLCSKMGRKMQIMNLIAGILSKLNDCSYLSNQVSDIPMREDYLEQNENEGTNRHQLRLQGVNQTMYNIIDNGGELQLPLKDNELEYCNDKLRSVGVYIEHSCLERPYDNTFTVALKYLPRNDHTLPLSYCDHDSATNDIKSPKEGRKRLRSS